VAICEQLEKPDPQKKIVKRGVTEIITPGVTLEHSLLDTKKNNFLAAIHFTKKDEIGIAFLDISTGEFLLSEGDFPNADKLIRSLNPSEIVVGKDKKSFAEKEWGGSFYLTWLDEWVCTYDYGRERLLNHFDVLNLKGFGIDDLSLGQVAAGAILHYLETTENRNLKHISTINRLQPENYVWLDRFTVRNLELIYSPHESGTSLLDVLEEGDTATFFNILENPSYYAKLGQLIPDVSNDQIEEEKNNFIDFVSQNIDRKQIADDIIKKVDKH
jgi:DNA mismatch repair protein MutS